MAEYTHELSEANRTLSHEIAERERLEEQLLQSQKMEAIGRLSGGIAHDFNNLLVPIMGYLDISLEELAPDDPIRFNLQQVREAADRAGELTRQILAFSSQQVMEMQTINLVDVIGGILEMVRRLIGEDIELKINLAESLNELLGDKTQIEQVIMNLVLNSRDALQKGGNLTIEVNNTFLDDAFFSDEPDVSIPGHYVMLAVFDTGHGMDNETRKHIFEPFFSTKEPGKGTGLGLATVFGIVKQHKGYIRIHSKPGEGTAVRIYFPVSEESVPTMKPCSVEPIQLGGTETILLVEDEDIVRNVICDSLWKNGYTIMTAENPVDCLGLVSGGDKEIDLLLTDVVMPSMNGKQLYDRLQKIYPGLKVLYISGYTSDIVTRHGILDEGIEFLQKPFSVDSLLRKLRTVLQRET